MAGAGDEIFYRYLQLIIHSLQTNAWMHIGAIFPSSLPAGKIAQIQVDDCSLNNQPLQSVTAACIHIKVSLFQSPFMAELPSRLDIIHKTREEALSANLKHGCTFFLSFG